MGIGSSRPEISVVMSAYDDDDRYLEETIQSVLSQEGVAFEFVIVNDGSTDGTEALLKRYERSDSRVRILTRENRGLTAALIEACSLARGSYIARQDAGDLSRPGRLARQKELLDRDPGLAFVSCFTEFRGPEMEYLYTARGKGRAREPMSVVGEKGGRPVVLDGPTHHGSVMFRKARYLDVGGYRREFYFAQDWDLWFRLVEVGTFQILREPLYVARVLPASRSTSFRTMQRELGGLARKAFELRVREMDERAVIEEAGRLRPRGGEGGESSGAAGYHFIGESLRRNRDPRCVRYFVRSLGRDPLRWRTWLRLLQAIPPVLSGGWRRATTGEADS